MTLIFPIVGLRHFFSEDKMYDLLYDSLPDGKELALLYDNANPHDRYAIQVWTDVPKVRQPPLLRALPDGGVAGHLFAFVVRGVVQGKFRRSPARLC